MNAKYRPCTLVKKVSELFASDLGQRMTKCAKEKPRSQFAKTVRNMHIAMEIAVKNLDKKSIEVNDVWEVIRIS